MDAVVRTALAADGTTDIMTIGARSRLPRRSEICFLHLDGRTFITGTPGPRNWYSNLLADARFIFHPKESIVADLAASAIPVLDEETRRWVFSQPHAWNDRYLSEAPLDELVSGAPMVEVVFE